MTYTIYFNQKPLLLSDSKSDIIKNLLKRPDTIFENCPNEIAIDSFIQKMPTENVGTGVIIDSNIEELLQAVKKRMKVIQAGGGLVHSDEEEILLIFRRGKWDLPKGKLEKGESMEAAALREVTEETGLKQLQIVERLTTTYHTYHEKGKLILKESYWYLMKSLQQERLTPQLEEDIEKCVWVKLTDLASYTENTHPSIIDVLKKGIEKLHQTKKI